ncbi:MAG: LemA family protein [Clostridia bacterium]|nr:LemA family protein [Clostridia bacterium]MDD4386982.1 LemA family protein [Clostridia bacterium]
MYLYILVGLVFVISIYLFLTYNVFIKLNNLVKEAFATMDVYFKKRWDLIPNIVETVKGYSMHEKETLEKVVKLRSEVYDNMSLNEKINTNEQLTKDISKLMMLVENYPDLKANQNFLELSKQLIKIEDDIANSRKYYNAVVRNLNNIVEMFPSNLVAKLFDFKSLKMFEVNNGERENIEVKL